jgi:hypothetical protein
VRVPRFPAHPPTVLGCEDKLLLALEMFATGCDLVRERLRREQPGASAEAIEELLQQWLRHRPPEEDAAIGRRVEWPRTLPANGHDSSMNSSRAQESPDPLP